MSIPRSAFSGVSAGYGRVVFKSVSTAVLVETAAKTVRTPMASNL
jgi:hypothetical protein